MVPDVNLPFASAGWTVRLGTCPTVLPLVFAVGVWVAVAGLPGCATLSEEDCLTLDWAVLGETDGQLGRPLSDLNRYRRECAEYGVVPDTEAYTQGRERGLAVYCTESNGYREGREGAAGRPVCPALLEPGFRRGYDAGRAVFVSLSELRNSNDAIASARDEIDHLESDIADHRESIRSDDLDDEERKALDGEIDSMERRIDRLDEDIKVLIAALAISIAQYHSAVDAARRDGHDEPMEYELVSALRRLVE